MYLISWVQRVLRPLLQTQVCVWEKYRTWKYFMCVKEKEINKSVTSYSFYWLGILCLYCVSLSLYWSISLHPSVSPPFLLSVHLSIRLIQSLLSLLSSFFCTPLFLILLPELLPHRSVARTLGVSGVHSIRVMLAWLLWRFINNFMLHLLVSLTCLCVFACQSLHLT